MTAASARASPPRISEALLAIYSLFALVVLVFAAPWFWWRSRNDPKLRASLAGRLGRGEVRQGTRSCVWFHAVSVGEVRLSRALIDALAARRPDLDLAISATTTAGLALARELHGGRPDRFVFQFPLDAKFAVRRVFERVRPEALVLVELELWPNLLAQARRSGVPIAVVNARVSARSFGRYRLLERFAPQFAQIDLWTAQDDEHAERLRALAVAPDRIVVAGNLKHDALRSECDEAKLSSMRAAFRLEPRARVLVSGSTHEGEEAILLALLPRLRARVPELRLVLAPRHVERADEVARTIERAGLRAARLTELRRTGAAAPADAILLVDTVGELEAVYALAELVFVGGTLVPRGGQNMLEPAALGRPTLFGPGTENFSREVERLRAHAGAVEVEDAEALGRELERLLADPDARRDLGDRARAAVAGLKGGTERTLAELLAWLERR